MKKCKISLSSQCFFDRLNNFTDIFLKDISIIARVLMQHRADGHNSETYNEQRTKLSRIKCCLQVGDQGMEKTVHCSSIYNTVLYCYSTILHYKARTMHGSSQFKTKLFQFLFLQTKEFCQIMQESSSCSICSY